MDPRYIEVVTENGTASNADGLSLGCTQCQHIIFEKDMTATNKLMVFDLVRASLRHSCATVERVTEIVSDAVQQADD